MVDLLLKAYKAVVDLARLGYNASSLIGNLNKAIALYSQGLKDEAYRIASEILDKAESLRPIAKFNHDLHIALTVLSIVAYATVLTLIILKRREIVGRFWLFFRGKAWIRSGDGRVRTLIYDEEVAAVILALVIVASIFAIASYIRSGQVVEPFTAIGLLGPTGKIGGYPTKVFPGEEMKLHIYVFNYMGVPTWLIVKIYITNDTKSMPPLPYKPIMTLQWVLPHNASHIEPIIVRAPKRPGRYRLIGELWMYDPYNLTLVYTGRFVQLWFNVTGVRR